MESNQFLAEAFRMLRNSGFHNLRADSEFIYMEDPACILRSFETFIDYAWFAITVLTGILILGWAISMIRGAKYDNIFINMRNLILIFGGLSLTKPVINIVYGEELFARACRTIRVSQTEVQQLLEARHEKLRKLNRDQMYEDLVIHDSGPVQILNAAETPVVSTETQTDETESDETESDEAAI